MKIKYINKQNNYFKIYRKEFIPLAKRAAFLSGLQLKHNQVLSISFVGKKTIKLINEKFLNHTGITDVICFNYLEDKTFLIDEEIEKNGEEEVAAELIIYPKKAEIESEQRTNVSFPYELTLYIVHGILHLVGKNDLNPADKASMKESEKNVMSELIREFDLDKIIIKI